MHNTLFRRSTAGDPSLHCLAANKSPRTGARVFNVDSGMLALQTDSQTNFEICYSTGASSTPHYNIREGPKVPSGLRFGFCSTSGRSDAQGPLRGHKTVGRRRDPPRVQGAAGTCQMRHASKVSLWFVCKEEKKASG